jgi:hypothetical protein
MCLRSTELDYLGDLEVSLARCRNVTAGHPSTGGGQLLPGPSNALGRFFRLSAEPYG